MAKWTPNRIGKTAGLALAVAAGVFVLLWDPPAPALEKVEVVRPAKVFSVTAASEASTRRFSGVVQPSAQVELSFRVSGPLVRLPIRRGKEVGEGDLLAEIDPRDFETRLARITGSLDEAKANLKAMKAGARQEEILRLENQLRAAKADFDNAVIELGRHQRLLDDEVISQSEFDQVKLRRDTAKEKMDAAEQALAQGRKGARAEDIEAQEATIRGLDAQRQEAQHDLDDTKLTAPFEGRVAKQYVENFQDVRAGEPVLSLQDVSRVEVVANVPETFIALAQKGAAESITATFESLGDRRFEVELTEMETEADARTQTYAVTVAMDAPEGVNLLPGMPAMVEVRLKPKAEEQAGFAVPATAVFVGDDGASMIWKVDPETNRVQASSVDTGEMSGDSIIVTGIAEGDIVVTAGVHFLEDDMEIRPLETGD